MKEFQCVCGSKEFYMVETTETLVDFSTEGAIEGHPAIHGNNTYFTQLRCVKCKTVVPGHVATEMRREII